MKLSPTAYFEAAQLAFVQARQRLGGSDQCYTLGPATIRLSFAGSALMPLLAPALAHLSADASAVPDLTICVFEGASNRLPSPRPMESVEEGTAAGRIHSHGDEEVQMTAGLGPRGLSLLHARRKLAVYWVPDACEIPPYVSAAPFLDILHWWMRDRGTQLVHGGAIGTPAGGVLLAGKGGAGKSTTALACISGDLQYAADDYCLVSVGEGPQVHSLYNSAKVYAAELDRFPGLRGAVSGRSDAEKSIVSLYPLERDNLIARFPLRAILVVRVAGRPETMLSPAPAGTVLRALAPSTIFQLSAADHRDFSFMAELARRLPGYFLDVGTDFAGIKAAVAGLLSAA